MSRALILLAAIGLAGCFDPSFHDTTCGVNDECPPGLSCMAGVCRSGAAPIDATDATDATDPDHPILTVVADGDGLGVVSSDPIGVLCSRNPSDCSQAFVLGTSVTLMVTPSVGSTFTGWSGAGCTGTEPCTIIMTASTTVTATFALDQHQLTVTRGGSGHGTVSSDPTGIDCGTTCAASFGHGTVVMLTAVADADSVFTRWGGAGCTTDPTCAVTVTSTGMITATFASTAPVVLTVVRAGDGFGRVSSTSVPIDCGTDCNETVTPGAVVVLTAAALGTPLSQKSTFAGWSGGGCIGTGDCTVTVEASTTVTATFTLDPNFAFVTSTSSTGNLGGLAGADAICQARANATGHPGTYRAWLSSTTASALSRLGTASGWIRMDGRPFARSQADLLAGRQAYPLRTDELGVDVGPAVTFTATSASGALSTSNGTCQNWTVNDPAMSVTAGSADSVGELWTVGRSSTCAETHRLACLGIDRTASLPPLPSVIGRRAFVSTSSFDPTTGGIGGADALCASNAASAGLPGTYRAFLATSTASAASRFNTTGQFIRVDYAFIASGTDLFSSPQWETGISLHADGTAVTSGTFCVTGATTPTISGSTMTCGNWLSQTLDSVPAGLVGATELGRAFSGSSGICFAGFPTAVYCLQQ